MSRRSVAQHSAAIAELLRPLSHLPTERIPLRQSLNRVLPDVISSPVDLPNFRNSQMDGYAVAASAIAQTPVTLPVSAVIAAGATQIGELARGCAAKIMTGSPIPPGADCVVPVEDTTAFGDHVTIASSRRPGEFIREAGSDVRAGQPLVPTNVPLAPRHLAAIAAAGITAVDVRRRPRVAIITSGDELVPAGQDLRPGQLYDSNGTALATSFEANGADVVRVTHTPDDPVTLRTLLDECADIADVIVTSGGVSMGDFEVVKETLAPLGGSFVKVAMQPGGPQGLSVYRDVPVLSFPGNPVSTLVSFVVFAQPNIREAAGLPAIPPATRRLAGTINSIDGKRQFVRGRYTAAGIEPLAGTGSHLVAGLAWADALIVIGESDTRIAEGTDVEILPL